MSRFTETRDKVLADIPRWPEEIKKVALVRKYGLKYSELDQILRTLPSNSDVAEGDASLTRISKNELDMEVEHEREMENLKKEARRIFG